MLVSRAYSLLGNNQEKVNARDGEILSKTGLFQTVYARSVRSQRSTSSASGSALQTIMDVFGRHGMAYQTDALNPGWNGDVVGPDEMAGLIYEHLYRRAATIYGGSTEVQKNIIAKGALGL